MNQDPKPSGHDARENEEYHASEEELAGIDRGLDDAEHGQFATEEEVRTAFAKFHGAVGGERSITGSAAPKMPRQLRGQTR